MQLRRQPASCPVPYLCGKIGLEICAIRRNVVREKPQNYCRKAWKLAQETHQLCTKADCKNPNVTSRLIDILIDILRFKSRGSECFKKKNSRLILATSTNRSSHGVNHKNCYWMVFEDDFEQKSDHLYVFRRFFASLDFFMYFVQHCFICCPSVKGSWYWTQDPCDFGIGSLTLWTLGKITPRDTRGFENQAFQRLIIFVSI